MNLTPADVVGRYRRRAHALRTLHDATTPNVAARAAKLKSDLDDLHRYLIFMIDSPALASALLWEKIILDGLVLDPESDMLHEDRARVRRVIRDRLAFERTHSGPEHDEDRRALDARLHARVVSAKKWRYSEVLFDGVGSLGDDERDTLTRLRDVGERNRRTTDARPVAALKSLEARGLITMPRRSSSGGSTRTGSAALTDKGRALLATVER